MGSLADRQSYRADLPVRPSVSGTKTYFWVGLALFGLAMAACAVPGSIYAQTFPLEMPFVGP